MVSRAKNALWNWAFLYDLKGRIYENMCTFFMDEAW